MKPISLIFVFLLSLVNVFSQTSIETNSQFKSDLIKFEVVDSMWIRITPIHDVVDSVLINEGLNQDEVSSNVITVLNQLRKEYGSNELTLSQNISDELSGSFEYGLPLDGITWSSIGFFNEYNYISIFENRELAFLRYELDVMCIDKDLFAEIINPNATQVGFYFNQNVEEQSYELAIYVK